MTPPLPTALIADDEPQMRIYLRRLLAETWPELEICAEAGNGLEAVEAIRVHRPAIAFLDIRMPGLSGLEAVEAFSEPCRIVFVTAYDEYAVAAFEKEAVDYLLKPVTMPRLVRTVARLKAEPRAYPPQMAQWLAELARRVAQGPPANHRQWLRVQHGDGVRLVPVDGVLYFQARDKYTTVITSSEAFLITKTIRDLSAELDPNRFWRIHRGTIVNLAHIDQVSRSLTGRGVVRLKNRPESLTISRRYLQQFKQM